VDGNFPGQNVGHYLNSHEKNGQARREERKIAMNGKRVEKQREGEKGKETLITETLTHKKKREADTSGNQRNAIQLGDTSIHPSSSLCCIST